MPRPKLPVVATFLLSSPFTTERFDLLWEVSEELIAGGTPVEWFQTGDALFSSIDRRFVERMNALMETGSFSLVQDATETRLLGTRGPGTRDGFWSA